MIAPSDSATTASVGQATAAKRHLFMFVICWIVVVDYLDRYLFGGIAESVKTTIPLSDTQIGFISGPAFAISYCLFTIPLGRLADRVSRVAVLAGLLAVWSVGVYLMSHAQDFSGLVFARLIIGLGQAGALAPAHSMVADLYPPHRRGGAMAVVGIAASLGAQLAPPVGGILTTTFGWQDGCRVLGGIGVATGILFILLFKQPVRGISEGRPSEPAKGDSFLAAAGSLFKRRSYRYLILALAFTTMADYGTQMWVTPLFARKLNMSPTEIGFQIFLYFGMASIIGSAAGGLMVDRLVRFNLRWGFWLPALATFLAAPLYLGLLLIKDPQLALRFLAIPTFLSMCWMAPSYALLQSLAGVRRRSVAASIAVFCANIVGGGVGPLLVGALSQALTVRFGAQGLTLAFVTMGPVFLAGSACFFLGARTLTEDLKDAREEQ
ncbi:MFS transporter [Sphingomonas crocodyli]|uniref:MFS transporter n=1 Tax=Sphingomonas crocodyli TaxID=1979270 RepID=A0A437M5U4_9SPHN|nr:MFS transporter [Sphingomonas crocodyli]RVT92916.1 MFS transporter [Sphingomonas crocodyli]